MLPLTAKPRAPTQRRPERQTTTVNLDTIGQCVNYSVNSPDGHIGTVAEVRYALREPRLPEALAIRAGRASTRLLIIPLSQLTKITHTTHRIALLSSPLITTTEATTPPRPRPRY